MTLPFRDRHDAGRQLAELLQAYAGRRVVVLGIPRGGVPVAYEVAHALHAPLDIFMVRHLVVRSQIEAGIGVVASGGVRVLNREVVEALRIPRQLVEEATHRERISLVARERTYRGQNVVAELRGRTVLLVDDVVGSAEALAEAVLALREHGPRTVVLAVPALPVATRARLHGLVDEVVSVITPPAAGEPERWYAEFLPISHTEVRALLSLSLAEGQSRELAGSI
jgi:putative phosphoribosyl transferase